jgi:hypothetical protein
MKNDSPARGDNVRFAGHGITNQATTVIIRARAAITMIAHSVTQIANGTRRFRCMFGQIQNAVRFLYHTGGGQDALKGAPKMGADPNVRKCPHLAPASRHALPKVIGARRCVRVLKATAKCYLDGDDELLIHPQQALRRPRRHAVERMLIGVAVLGPRCCPTLLPAHLSREALINVAVRP